MKISENILKYTNEYFQKNEFTIAVKNHRRGMLQWQIFDLPLQRFILRYTASVYRRYTGRSVILHRDRIFMFERKIRKL